MSQHDSQSVTSVTIPTLEVPVGVCFSAPNSVHFTHVDMFRNGCNLCSVPIYKELFLFLLLQIKHDQQKRVWPSTGNVRKRLHWQHFITDDLILH